MATFASNEVTAASVGGRGSVLSAFEAGGKTRPFRMAPKSVADAKSGGSGVTKKNSYPFEDLLKSAHGLLFGPGNARLPLPPLLMFDRIVKITEDGGQYDKGEIVAELDVRPDLWYFDCHFETDPVMPGCLGLDALWQLLGFFLGWLDLPGVGRALGVGKVRFTGQVLPSASKISYLVNVKRVIRQKLVLGIADGVMKVDGRDIYQANDLRVGLFTSTQGF